MEHTILKSHCWFTYDPLGSDAAKAEEVIDFIHKKDLKIYLHPREDFKGLELRIGDYAWITGADTILQFLKFDRKK